MSLTKNISATLKSQDENPSKVLAPKEQDSR